jgi:fructose transport system substrate-binding protein
MTQRIVKSRRTLRGWRCAAAATAVALLVAGCGGSSGGSTGAASGGGKKITVGLITKTDTNPFFVKIRKARRRPLTPTA